MKRIASPLVVAGVAAGLLLVGTTAADAHSPGVHAAATARPDSTSVHVTFTAKTQDSADYSKSDGIYFAEDYSGKLGLVGYNMVSSSSKGTWIVVTFQGGFVYLTVTGVVGSSTLTGVVTGGSGTFARARGTFVNKFTATKGVSTYAITLTK